MKRFRLPVLIFGLVLLLTACPQPEVPLSAPSNVQATAQPGAISVTWQHSGGADAFLISRSVNGGPLQPLTDTVSGSARSYIDTAVLADNAYRYAVAARKGSEVSTVVLQPNTPVSPLPGEAFTVSLSSSSTNVSEASTITLSATISGGPASKVSFLRGSTPIAEDTSEPFGASVNLTAADNGEITFRAVATHSDGRTAEASVGITVNIISGPFTASDDNYTAVINTPLAVGATSPSKSAVRLAGSVLDNDGASGLSVVGEAKNVSSGSVTLNADGTFIFTPVLNSTSTVTFDYDVTNGSTTQSATVTITLLDANGVAGGSARLWYVDNSSTTTPRTGAATAAFDSILTAISTAAEGDSIYILKGSTYSGTLIPKANQKILGQGVNLTVGEQTLVEGSLTEMPVLTATGDGVFLAGGIGYLSIGTIEFRGLSFENIGDPNWETSGDTVLKAGFFTNNVRGTIIIEDVDIINPYGSGMYLDHGNLGDDPRATFIIRGVRITDPKQFGIWVDDADLLDINSSTRRPTRIIGLRNPAVLGNYAGVGIDPQDEFGGDVIIRNVEISGNVDPNVTGIRFIKNNKTVSKASGLVIEGNTITLSGGDARGIDIHIYEGNEGPDKVYEGKGDVNLSGTVRNSVSVSSAGLVFTPRTLTILPEGEGFSFTFTDNSPRIKGQINVNGSLRP